MSYPPSVDADVEHRNGIDWRRHTQVEIRHDATGTFTSESHILLRKIAEVVEYHLLCVSPEVGT